MEIRIFSLFVYTPDFMTKLLLEGRAGGKLSRVHGPKVKFGMGLLAQTLLSNPQENESL